MTHSARPPLAPGLFVCAALLAFAPVVPRARAQVGDEGRITTRSDVRMAVEGAPGTVGPKLQALANTLGAPLGEVKRCYGELVKKHPEVVGSLEVQLELPERGALKVVAPGSNKQFGPMQRCVDRAFAKLDVRSVPRPAGARLTLELTNSAAASVDDVRAREETAKKVELVEAAGAVEARGASLGGEVSYTVRGRGRNAEQLVEHLANEVRSALPGLFDCRRRASKLGSPEGDITLKLKLAGKGPLSTDTVSSTVANERAPICVASALRRNVARALSGSADLVVSFAPPRPSDAE